MMKMRKATAIILSAAMALSMAACGGSGQTQEASADTQTAAGGQAAASEETADTGEAPVIKISLPALAAPPSEEGTAQVEEALNAYLEEQNINVRVDLDPMDVTNYATQVDMQIVSGDKIDIYCPLGGLNVEVQNNKVLPLDDYLDNELADTVALMGEDYIKACSYNGKIYGLPRYSGDVTEMYWICRKDVFDGLGIDRESITNVRELGDVFEKIKEQNPNMSPIATIVGADYNEVGLVNTLGLAGDYAATDLGNGLCVVGTDNTTVQNLFATDYYKEAVQIAYDWNQKGYIPDDASVTTDQRDDVVVSGRAASFIIGYGYDVESVEETTMNGANPIESVAIPLGETLITSQGSVVWSVAYTCKNPAAAATILNLLYTDEYFLNTLLYGVEGTDWVDAGTGDGSILWPEGQNMDSVPYTMALTCGMIGNRFLMYSMDGISKASDLPFMEENNEKGIMSPVYGFNIDVANIRTQVSAVNNVVAQYRSGLETGELDPEVYLPRMLEELEAAGMGDIVAEAQSQLDTWLAENG